ncbi:MAG: glycosyltransferase, partial [Acidimicrobiia bacterium]
AEDTEVLFVNEWLLGVASRIAEAHQLKLINIAMQPRIKTRQTQIAIMPAWPSWAPFRETYNVLTYDLMSYFKWFSHARPVNSRLKTDPRLNSLSARDYVALFDHTPSLTLISRHVMPRPSDWAEHHHLTGYLFYDDAGWRPPAKLVNFIQSSDAPIYIGFGSIQDRRPDETTRLILSALKKTRQRAVLLSGWSELGQIDLPETVYRLDYAPHSWLFPRVKAVVHHAGAGTTAAALRAGIPSVTIPHSGDQPFWARRLYQLGAGTVPLPKYRLNSAYLADRIIKALEDEQMRSRAEELGKKIGDENSVSKTIAVINDLL